MSAFLDAVAAHLTTAGVASSSWPAHKHAAQNDPDTAITLYETGGPVEHASDRSWAEPSFQAVARALTIKLARDKAEAVRLALDAAAVSGFDHFIATQATPLYLGPDERGRHRFSINFRAGES
jgi:Bacteriophage minor capsid protein